MTEHKIGALIVLEEGSLAGIITYTDLLEALTTFSAYCKHCYRRNAAPGENV